MVRAAHRNRPRPDLRKPGTALLAAATILAGCALPMTETDTEAMEAPQAPPSAELTPIPQEALPPADDVAAYFAGLEAQRRANGLMRQERAPRDLPFSARDLEQAFVRIALYEEYAFDSGRIVERATPSTLRRWQRPVRMRVEFGESVSEATRQLDRRFLRSYAARLGQLTGHPVSLTDGTGNFHVLVLSEEERRAAGPRLRQLVPGIDSVTLDLVTNLPLSVSCLVLAFSRGGSNLYTDAIAVIRAELPDLSRRACYYEELAQGMGLPNDHPRVRPSLFNDTAEFAVLTALDENLLRMLYDPRLRPGMREDEARPILREIAQELMGGAS